jgi:hypothetical protein
VQLLEICPGDFDLLGSTHVRGLDRLSTEGSDSHFVCGIDLTCTCGAWANAAVLHDTTIAHRDIDCFSAEGADSRLACGIAAGVSIHQESKR